MGLEFMELKKKKFGPKDCSLILGKGKPVSVECH